MPAPTAAPASQPSTDQQTEQPAPDAAAGGAGRRQIDRLLQVDLAAIVADHDAGVFQIDQVLDLKLAQLVQYLVGGLAFLIRDAAPLRLPRQGPAARVRATCGLPAQSGPVGIRRAPRG